MARRFSASRALTVGLVTTYTSINEKYYAALETRRRLSELSPTTSPKRSGRNRTSENSTATESWMLPARRQPGNAREVVRERYLLDKVLGRGSFGKVVLAYDLAKDRHVAIKVIERSKRTASAVKQEVEILRQLNGGSIGDDESEESGSGEDSSSMHKLAGKDACVRLLDFFTHQADKPDGGFQCLVFEIMSFSLYDVLRVTNLSGVSVKLVRKLSVQILQALEYTKSLGIIHCDVKPENVLLCHPERSAVKLIDFGSACKCGTQQFSYVQSRFYRAPEVILGMKYGPAIDMWSAGCMLYELRTGTPLFMGWSEHDQLCKMEATLGRIPQSLYDYVPGEYRTRYFDVSGRMKPSPELLSAAKKNKTPLPTPGSRPIALAMRDELAKHEASTSAATSQVEDGEGRMDVGYDRTMRDGASVADHGEFDEEHDILLALISRMVTLDPKRRITPEQALEHPFFYPLAGKVVLDRGVSKNILEKRLSSIPDMSTMDAMNAREAQNGVGERFSFSVTDPEHKL